MLPSKEMETVFDEEFNWVNSKVIIFNSKRIL